MTQTKSAPEKPSTANPHTNATTVLDKVFSNPLFAKMDRVALLKQLNILETGGKNNLVTAPAPTPQTSPNISSIPSNGIIINQPGTYTFTNNITWSPAGAGAAITIAADNVTLNLSTFTLTIYNIPPINALHYNGIEIISSGNGATTLNNVIVQNGNISGATYYGVKAINTQNLQLSQLIISDIYYINVQPTKNIETPAGIFIEFANNPSVQNCNVQNIGVTAPSCAGIQIIFAIGNPATNAISGCTLSNFVNNDGAVQGFSYLACMDLNTTGCVSQNFRSHYLGLTQTSGHTVIGYVPIVCYGLVFTDCSSSDMTGCCDDCHGMSVFIDANVTVNNFTATNIIDGDCIANTGAKATGLEVYGIGVTLNNCTSTNITAIVPQDLQSAGFSAWGDTIIFNNCTANNVQVLDAARTPSTTLGYGAGFGWAPDPRGTPYNFNSTPANKVQYNNCTSNSCQLGFDTWFHTNSVWTNPSVNNCGTFILAQPDTATRTFGMNRCSEAPTPLPNNQITPVTITNKAANNTYPSQP